MKSVFVVGVVVASGVLGLWAETQIWNDAGADNLWSTNAANWADSAVWTNGNMALFTGNNGTSQGGAIDVDGAVIFSGMRFLTNGYTVADANNNGTLTLTNQPNIETVSTVGTTIISEALSGAGGFNKIGAGILQLTASNTYSGVTTVKAGTLRLSHNVPTALGATGTGNETVVENGATLDIYSAYTVQVSEDVTIIGSGVNGAGAFVNNGPTPYYNVGYRNLTLAGDAVIGGTQRFDMAGHGAYYGHGFTLIKTGSCEVAVGRPVTNSPIIINAGVYTIQHVSALGGSDYPTTLNNGKLMAWGNYTITERIFANGGTLSANGTGINTFTSAGHVTLGGNLTVQTETSSTNTLELAGIMDGSGGFTRNGGGTVYVTNNANTYSGPTIVNSGSRLWVGKTVGGTGILGTGVTTNNGTLFANSPVLTSGAVVNNNSGLLVLAPPTLTVGRLVNQSGTVYGTSVVQTVNGVVNMSTWQSYSGDFGSSAVTNASGGTMNLYTNQLVYGQFVNNGRINLWQPITIATPMTFNGGSVYVSDSAGTLNWTGPITTEGLAVFEGTNGSSVEISGVVSGNGGVVRSGDGACYILNDNNTYTGPTVINSGKTLWVGKLGETSIGRLGSGDVTNNGTLYANSPVLSTGNVINNSSGKLYLNAPSVSVGRLVNQSGTVYGTSLVNAVNGVVNAGTWQSYSGDFGSSVVTNASGGTLNLYTNQLVYGAFVNGGRLNFWQPMNMTTPITFNGGSIYVSDAAVTLNWAGAITTETLANFDGTNTSVVEVSGVISGPGGIGRTGDGTCTILADNTYTGATVVNGGRSLWVGKPGVMTGHLGSGTITNNGSLYLDHPGAYELANGMNGGGTLYVRYGANITMNGCGVTNNIVRLAQGTISLVNGTYFAIPGEMVISDRLNVNYTSTPTNVQFVVNVTTGCTLVAANITFGNGSDLPNGSITGILNQVGGVVRTTSAAAEGNGVRLGHYPQARSIYNMMGGTLLVEGNWDLGCATDGNGWFNMTGGEVFTKRVMLNERDGGGGYGRLTMAGGTLNVGSLTGSDLAISNAICADKDAPYFVELGGGAHPTIRAVTNLWIPVKATLSGSGASAITFDAQQWTISLTNQLSGTGGLNTKGSGTVLLSGSNTFTGLTQVTEGTLCLARAGALAAVPLAVASNAVLDLGGFGVAAKSLSGAGVVTNGGLTVSGIIAPDGNDIGTLTLALTNSVVGGTLVIDADANGDCDRLVVLGSLDLLNMSLQVVEHNTLDVHKRYTIAQCEGTLSGIFNQKSLPSPWFVYCDYAAKKVVLSAQVGTVIRLH